MEDNYEELEEEIKEEDTPLSKEDELKKHGENLMSILYIKMRLLKRNMAVAACNKIVDMIEDHEAMFERGCRIANNTWLGYDVLKKEPFEVKFVFFWTMLGRGIKNEDKKLLEKLPEKQHFYSEENFDILCEVLQFERWTVVNVRDSRETDAESAIMGALRHGGGDDWGF